MAVFKPHLMLHASCDTCIDCQVLGVVHRLIDFQQNRAGESFCCSRMQVFVRAPEQKRKPLQAAQGDALDVMDGVGVES